MNRPPAFQFYADDFIGGTVDLSAEDVGAYIRLLCYQWGRGAIPASKAAIDRVAGCDVSSEVLAKFPDGKNHRMERERLKQDEWREKCRKGGQNSAISKNVSRVVELPHQVKGQVNGNTPLSTLHSPPSVSGFQSPPPSPSSKEPQAALPREIFPPSIESIKLQCAKIGLPDSEGDKFFNFYASKGWMVGRTKMKSWTHALTGWRGRWQESAKAKQSAPESIFNLRTVMEAKAKLAAELHNRHATETGLGTDWNDPAKRAEYVGLKREIKALNERIAGAA